MNSHEIIRAGQRVIGIEAAAGVSLSCATCLQDVAPLVTQNCSESCLNPAGPTADCVPCATAIAGDLFLNPVASLFGNQRGRCVAPVGGGDGEVIAVTIEKHFSQTLRVLAGLLSLFSFPKAFFSTFHVTGQLFHQFGLEFRLRLASSLHGLVDGGVPGKKPGKHQLCLRQIIFQILVVVFVTHPVRFPFWG